MNRMLRSGRCAGTFFVGPFFVGLCVLTWSGQCSAADKKEVGKQIAKIVWLEVDKAGDLPKSAKIDKDSDFGEVVKITRTPDEPHQPKAHEHRTKKNAEREWENADGDSGRDPNR